MKALVFGVRPEAVEVPDSANALTRNLARTPTALREVPDPQLPHQDWVITRPRLTGICGSDSKQILMDFGEDDVDNAMSSFCSFPQVMGHEVVADVVELGPRARGLDVGQRVVLNPWLSCGPRGIEPPCPACETGDYSLCWSFTDGDIKPGIHTGVSADVTGGYAELMPAHDSMLFGVPDSIPDEMAVFADPFSVSLHAITRHPPPRSGRVLVYGAGSLGLCAVAILRALYPHVAVAVVARFRAQAELAGSSARPRCSHTSRGWPSSRSWSPGAADGCGSRFKACRWHIPVRSRSSTTRSASPRLSRWGCGSSRPGARW
jgi:threonine dehydrogenase-like Zn-dependent dehydrogenase